METVVIILVIVAITVVCAWRRPIRAVVRPRLCIAGFVSGKRITTDGLRVALYNHLGGGYGRRRRVSLRQLAQQLGLPSPRNQRTRRRLAVILRRERLIVKRRLSGTIPTVVRLVA